VVSDQADAYHYALAHLERQLRGAYQLPAPAMRLTCLDPRQLPSELKEPAMEPNEYERLFPPDDEPPAQTHQLVELHVQERAEPVGFVTAKRLIRDPAELTAMQALAQAYNHERGLPHSPEGCCLCEPEPLACAHRKQVPVTLLVTGEHVANLCTDCLAQLPPRETPSA
jgi:hypothetical protein